MLKKDVPAWLEKVGDDEPIFILRAQDMTMPELVRYWATRVRNLYEKEFTKTPRVPPVLTSTQYTKLAEAMECADDADKWAYVQEPVLDPKTKQPTGEFTTRLRTKVPD